ncbi:hypothetical protein D1AOALGA4SA_11279 [Olavius algarvensis Delta 1 endosymbiont]|nr:hypothetical protein D1AOALGA4SA_11279 [Olavius algarvensis Delta 1 endosymbiont]
MSRMKTRPLSFFEDDIKNRISNIEQGIMNFEVRYSIIFI